MKLSFIASALLSISPLVRGTPILGNTDGVAVSIDTRDDKSTQPLKGKNLKILALGDSITSGYKSSDGNGYLHHLLNQLTYGGAKPTFIGSQQSGVGKIKNEGHNGAKINDVAAFAKESFKEKPNVVLLHIGTNDMVQNDDVQHAPERLGKLVDDITAAVPDAFVVVAQIIPNHDAKVEALIKAYNSKIQSIMSPKQDKGLYIQVINMSSDQFVKDAQSQSPKLYAAKDNTHPSDLGYRKMATQWNAALGEAAKHKVLDGDIFN